MSRDNRPTLTPRQRDLVNVIRDFLRDRGYPPTLQEASERMGIAPGVCHRLARRIVEKGYLKSRPGVARGIVPADPN